MSQPRTALLRLESFGGGLNDTDQPHRIGDDQLLEAINVELTTNGAVKSRPGAQRFLTSPATSGVQHVLHRHTPTQALSATELWAIPASATNFYRSASGTSWANVSVSDTGASTAPTDAVSFNGKLYIAYKKNAGTDRLHCWDGSTLRRVGISTPSAPTVGNTGAGSYAATLRYYKVQFQTEGPTGRFTLSDLSEATSFTPSGTGTAARVTKPTTPDDATAWRVWGSADGVTYYLLASQAVGTTTYDDSTAPASYATSNVGVNFLPADSGEYTPPWSAKYLLVDENRLLIAGAYETTRYASRVGWSAIIGTATSAYGEIAPISDDERFPPDNYLDLDSDEGGEITGMEMLNGSVYVFKRYALYKLVRTGNATAPYKPVVITKVIGALSRKSIVPGEDESGTPCLYFLSERGPYRLGGAGLQYLGGDIETLWSTVNLRPTTSQAHGVYDPRRSQVRWWVPSTTSSQWPDKQITFHVRLGRPIQAGRVRGGWTTAVGTCQAVTASALFPSDLSNRDTPLIPIAIRVTTGTWYPVVWSYVTSVSVDDDIASGSTVSGTVNITPTFQTKYVALGLGDRSGVRDVYVTLKPSGTQTLTVGLARDFGVETRTASESWTGTTRAPKQIPDLTMAQAQYISVTLTSTSSVAFSVDDIALRISREEPV